MLCQFSLKSDDVGGFGAAKGLLSMQITGRALRKNYHLFLFLMRALGLSC